MKCVTRTAAFKCDVTGNRNEALGVSETSLETGFLGKIGTETSLEMEQTLENCTARAPKLHRAVNTAESHGIIDNGKISGQRG